MESILGKKEREKAPNKNGDHQRPVTEGGDSRGNWKLSKNCKEKNGVEGVQVGEYRQCKGPEFKNQGSTWTNGKTNARGKLSLQKIQKTTSKKERCKEENWAQDKFKDIEEMKESGKGPSGKGGRGITEKGRDSPGREKV